VKPKWIEGPPSARGNYWIVWQDDKGKRDVIAVDVSPDLIYIKDEKAPLRLKLLGGMAYDFEANRSHITHHMPMVAPEAP